LSGKPDNLSYHILPLKEIEKPLKLKLVNYHQLEAKQAALGSRKLTQTEIIQFPLEVEDTLSFHVVLYGTSSDFTKDYHAVLLYKNKPIQPIIEQNDTHAKPANLGVRISTSYRAICKYDFPNYYVEPDAEVILVIISPLNKERMFVFHLKEMR